MNPHKLIRRPAVRAIAGEMSDSTIDRLERAGEFPRRVRIGPNSIAWHEHEVIAWVESRTRGGPTPPEPAIAERAKRRAELAAAGGRDEMQRDAPAGGRAPRPSITVTGPPELDDGPTPTV